MGIEWGDDAVDLARHETPSGPSAPAPGAGIAARHPHSVLLGAAEYERDKYKTALERIASEHIPDQPADAYGDELTWAQQHVARLRRIARDAVNQQDVPMSNDAPLKGCRHSKTFTERCIECELVSAREGERWALESLTKYRKRIEQLETEGLCKEQKI